MEPKWIEWSKRLASISQNGLEYSKEAFDIERYTAVREIATEILGEHTGTDVTQIRDLFARERGHATPKVDVRGVVFQKDRLLLVRELDDGMWTVPGGWADVNESASEAVVREVYEESGYHTDAVKLLALYDRARHKHPPYPFSVYMIFFLCELTGGSPQKSVETDMVAFFGRNELPDLSRYRVTPAQLDRLFQLRECPQSPTVFD